eukprot:1138926-Pelagomonas_calceolata.AAC.5
MPFREGGPWVGPISKGHCNHSGPPTCIPQGHKHFTTPREWDFLVKNKCKLCAHAVLGGATCIRQHFLKISGFRLAMCAAAEDKREREA